MFWIASAPKIYAVYFNEEWNKKAGSNDLLREQFIIALLVLLFIYLFFFFWGGMRGKFLWIRQKFAKR